VADNRSSSFDGMPQPGHGDLVWLMMVQADGCTQATESWFGMLPCKIDASKIWKQQHFLKRSQNYIRDLLSA
jgi:hypothetical protein